MADLNHPDGGAGNPEVHHEESDVNIRAILGFGGVLIVATGFVLVLMWLLFRSFAAREAKQAPLMYPLAAGQDDRVPPEPRLQTNPREDLADLRAHEDALLHSYGWVNRNAGVVRIPIDDAIRLTLERGLPSRQETQR
jgi:hypothetical protein